MTILAFLAARLAEPSTWASIAAVLVAAHVSVDPGLWQHIVDAGIGVSGLLGAVLAEQKPAPVNPPAKVGS